MAWTEMKVDSLQFERALAATRRFNEALAEFGTTFAESLARITEALGSSTIIDQLAIDATPHLCWRCDAREAQSTIGLCETCRTDLAG